MTALVAPMVEGERMLVQEPLVPEPPRPLFGMRRRRRRFRYLPWDLNSPRPPGPSSTSHRPRPRSAPTLCSRSRPCAGLIRHRPSNGTAPAHVALSDDDRGVRGTQDFCR